MEDTTVYRLIVRGDLTLAIAAELKAQGFLDDKFGYMPLEAHVACEAHKPGATRPKKQGLYANNELEQLAIALERVGQTAFSGSISSGLAIYDRSRLNETNLNGAGMPMSLKNEDDSSSALVRMYLFNFQY